MGEGHSDAWPLVDIEWVGLWGSLIMMASGRSNGEGDT